MIWKMPITLEDINNRSKNTAAMHLGIEFTEIGSDYLVATLPITEKVIQPLGLLHGGISVALAETVASSASNYCVDQDAYYCVGLEINANHIRSVTGGVVTATLVNLNAPSFPVDLTCGPRQRSLKSPCE